MLAVPLWLHLQPPPEWGITTDAARRTARPPGGGLVVEWRPLGALPRNQIDWARRVLGESLEPGQALGALELNLVETVSGWPLLLAEAPVHGGAWARRLAAFYAFFEHGGWARAHATDPAMWASAQMPLRAMLAAGAPDFGALVVAMEQLYEP